MRSEDELRNELARMIKQREDTIVELNRQAAEIINSIDARISAFRWMIEGDPAPADMSMLSIAE
jgi:hypothetical protein